MAFAQGAEKFRNVEGKLVHVCIAFSNGGADTGGTIKTGLKTVLSAFGVPTGAVDATSQIRVTGISGGDVTIATIADVDGELHAWGYGY